MQTECSPLKIVRVPLALAPTAQVARTTPPRQIPTSKTAAVRQRAPFPASEGVLPKPSGGKARHSVHAASPTDYWKMWFFSHLGRRARSDAPYLSPFEPF